MAMIGEPKHLMIRAQLPTWATSGPWDPQMGTTIALHRMAILQIRGTQKGLSSLNASRSHSISRNHYVPSANPTDNRSGLILGYLRLDNRFTTNRCPLVFLAVRGPP